MAKGSNPLKATRIAIAGLAAATRHELAFRLELAAMAVMLPLGLYLGNSGVERALLVGSLFLVLLAELLNSALEAALDRISLEHHPLIGRAKDMAAAAVFVSILGTVAVWLLVLFG
jgi:diacylglycerol kinase (ATP)